MHCSLFDLHHHCLSDTITHNIAKRIINKLKSRYIQVITRSFNFIFASEMKRNGNVQFCYRWALSQSIPNASNITMKHCHTDIISVIRPCWTKTARSSVIKNPFTWESKFAVTSHFYEWVAFSTQIHVGDDLLGEDLALDEPVGEWTECNDSTEYPPESTSYRTM